MTALHQPTWAIGLLWYDSRIIHSRIANADIQALQIVNSKERVYYELGVKAKKCP